MPPRYKNLEKCREQIQKYADYLSSGTDDDDDELRGTSSTTRYLQDLRWFDHWLDDQGIEDVADLTKGQGNQLIIELSDSFNGTTSLYRWDRIYAMFNWLSAKETISKNPLTEWDVEKKSYGLTKSTEQKKQLDNEDKYAVTKEEVRKMEEAVSRHRVRDQLLIRAEGQLLTEFYRSDIVCNRHSLSVADDGKRDLHAIYSTTQEPSEGTEQVVESVVPEATEEVVTLEGFYEEEQEWTNFEKETEQVEHDSVEDAISHVKEVLA